jgi:hypothetical protein
MYAIGYWIVVILVVIVLLPISGAFEVVSGLFFLALISFYFLRWLFTGKGVD